MEKYAIEKVSRLSKYHPRIEKISVRLIGEKAHRNENHDYTCELIIAIPGRDLEVLEKDRNMDKAIDVALDRMKRLLVRSKEKSMSRKHRLAGLRKIFDRF